MTEPAPLDPTDPDPRRLATALGPVGVAAEGPTGGLPLLCIHGLPGSTRDWRYLAPYLTPRFRVIRLDMPGFASSPRGVVRRMADWARVPAAVADALELDRYALLAHSYGGGGALLAAGRGDPRVAGLALAASVGASRHRAYAWPRAVVALLLLAAATPVLSRRIFRLALDQYRRLGLPQPTDLAELRHHLRLMASLDFPGIGRAARRVPCPALVAYALDDPLVQPRIGRELLTLLPHATALELADGGHHLQKTRTPELADAIRTL